MIKNESFRLYNADCFDIFPQITNKSIDLIIADLPYGITACKWDCVLPLDKLWCEYTRVIKNDGCIILTATQPFAWRLCASNPEWFKYDIIWEKSNGTNPLLVKKQPFRVHENILIFYKKQPTYNPQMTYGSSTYGGFSDSTKTIGEAYSGTKKENSLISKHKQNIDGSRYPRSVLKIRQDRSGHPTKKPVELMSWLVKTYSNVGELVMDNTMGEGTTGVACMLADRKFIGIELDKGYFEIAKQSITDTYNQCRLEL